MINTGKIFTISSPSGAGKTSLWKMLLKKHKDIKYSVSYTTRLPRVNEIQGKDYNFVDKLTFKDLIKKNKFIEWVSFSGNYYGSLMEPINLAILQNKNILLEIDSEGLKQLRKKIGSGVYIYIVTKKISDLKCEKGFFERPYLWEPYI